MLINMDNEYNRDIKEKQDGRDEFSMDREV